MNKLIHAVFFIIIIFTSGIVFSQGIITDRPDKTESVETVGKGKFQIEAGIEYSLLKYENAYNESGQFVDLKFKTLTAPTTLLRYGILKNLELRFGFDFDRTTVSSSDTVEFDNSEGLTLSSPTIGAKFHIYDGKDIVPAFAIIAAFTIPNVGADFKQTKYLNPEILLSFSNEINEKLSLGYNLGFEHDNDVKATNFFYSASLGISLTPKLGSFIELYGNFPTDNYLSNQNVDGGFTYLIENNIQVDVYGGLGLSTESNNFILGTGISFKF